MMAQVKSYDKPTAIGLGIFLLVMGVLSVGLGLWGMWDDRIQRWQLYHHYDLLSYLPVQCFWTGGLWVITACLSTSAGARRNICCIRASLAFNILSCLGSMSMAAVPAILLNIFIGQCYNCGKMDERNTGTLTTPAEYWNHCYNRLPYVCRHGWTLGSPNMFGFIWTCILLGLLGCIVTGALAAISNSAACCNSTKEDSHNQVTPMSTHSQLVSPPLQYPMVSTIPVSPMIPMYYGPGYAQMPQPNIAPIPKQHRLNRSPKDDNTDIPETTSEEPENGDHETNHHQRNSNRKQRENEESGQNTQRSIKNPEMEQLDRYNVRLDNSLKQLESLLKSPAMLD